MDRKQLRKVYLFVVELFAVDADEVSDSLGISKKDATAALKRLQAKNLVDSTHVNNERKLTWQSYYDIDNDDAQDGMERAAADFDKAFPPSKKPAKKATHAGATGPAYTKAQIRKGINARKRALSWERVAEEAGVKAASYFSRIVREAHGSDPKGSK